MKKKYPQYKHQFYNGSFVDYAGRTREFILCAVSIPYYTVEYPNGKVLVLGASVKAPNDQYNETIGKQIAYGKALKNVANRRIFCTDPEMINTEMVNLILKKEAVFLAQEPDKYIKRYNHDKERYFAQESKKLFKTMEKVDVISLNNIQSGKIITSGEEKTEFSTPNDASTITFANNKIDNVPGAYDKNLHHKEGKHAVIETSTKIREDSTDKAPIPQTIYIPHCWCEQDFKVTLTPINNKDNSGSLTYTIDADGTISSAISTIDV